MDKKRNKRAIRVAAILIAMVCLIAVGCDSGKGSKTKTDGLTHERLITATDHDLIVNNSTSYKIVYPEDKGIYIDEAVSELQLFFGQASGCKIQAISDADLNWDKSSEYISLGQTSLLEQADLTLGGYEFGSNDGYEIVTKGNTVFIAGGGELGTLFGVYDFLECQLGYEYYAVDEIFINNVSNCKLLNFDVCEKPDIEYRVTAFGEIYASDSSAAMQGAHRLKTDRETDFWCYFDYEKYHTFFKIVPPEECKTEHLDWYSPNSSQLCLSRDVEGLSEYVLEKIKKKIVEQPYGKIISFSQEDNSSWCSCEKCSEIIAKYGAASATNLIFNNILAKEINRWLAAESGDPLGSYTDDFKAVYGVEGDRNREVDIFMFAYCATESAPATKQANGEFVSNMSDIELEDSVTVMYAPITNEHCYPYNSSKNMVLSDTLKAWQAVLKNVGFYGYTCYIDNFFLPFSTVNVQQENIQYLYDHDVNFYFEQAQGNSDLMGSDWYRLKQYLSSKTLWNIEVDYQAETEKFMRNYYKDAWETMYELYRAEQEWLVITHEGLDRPGRVDWHAQAAAQKYWPKALLNHFLELTDQAFSEIKKYKTVNSALYEKLYNRILNETLPFRYLLLLNYGSSYTSEEYQAKKQALRDDVVSFGMSGPATLKVIDTLT